MFLVITSLSEWSNLDWLTFKNHKTFVQFEAKKINLPKRNISLQEEDLDSQQGVIDFSLYLRGSNSSSDLASNSNNANNEPKQRHINTMLDQKNYIEELNRHLK